MTARHSYAIPFAVAVLVLYPALRAQDSRFVVFEGGQHGYINQKGVLVIPISLEVTYVINFSEERASFAEAVKPTPAKYPYLDKNGKLRIFREEKWGFIDMSGAVAVPPRFDAAMDFSEGLAGIAFDTDRTSYSCTDCDKNQHWGFIDKQGKVVIRAQYHSVRSFSEGFAAVESDDGKWGYIDTKGNLIVPFYFQAARSFHEDLAAAAVDKQVGYIDKHGSFAVKPRFAIAGDFSGGLAAVRVGGKTDSIIVGPAGGRWAFIGKDGRNRIDLPKNAERAEGFAEGLAVIEVHGHCGYIDPSGAIAIPLKFSYCGSLSEGLADVGKDGTWQYIDRSGQVAIDVPYSGIHPFKNGLAAVEDGADGPTQRFGYIDKRGNQVWKPRPAL
ncbi:MAG: WG repeat-containing protein [Bryobacteraceae bacterium]|jgi:hypothetical protein